MQAADVVVTMGCGDACPLFPGKRYEDWELDDPAGQGVDAVRPIRDEIGARVRTLLDELGVALHLLVAVADAAHGHDAFGVSRVLLDLGPQPLDVHIERLGVAVVVRAPRRGR